MIDFEEDRPAREWEAEAIAAGEAAEREHDELVGTPRWRLYRRWVLRGRIAARHDAVASAAWLASDARRREQALAETGTEVQIPNAGYRTAFSAVRAVIEAANPGQVVVVRRSHIDRDGRYFRVTVHPHATQVQVRAAELRQPSLREEEGR